MPNEKPALCNNPPDLGAAAIVTVNLGARSYREGKAFFFDQQAKHETQADESWAARLGEDVEGSRPSGHMCQAGRQGITAACYARPST